MILLLVAVDLSNCEMKLKVDVQKEYHTDS